MSSHITNEALFDGLQQFKTYIQANFPYKATMFEGTNDPSVSGQVGNIPSFYIQKDVGGNALATWYKSGLAATAWTRLATIADANITASNLGAGTGIFSNKVGTDLRFKSLVAGTNISVSSDADTVTVSANTTTATNVGSGSGVFKQLVGNNLELKSIKAGTNVILSADANEITVSSVDTGEVNTASNLGTGQGVFFDKLGVDLRLKSFVAGTNVSLSSTNNEITINAATTGEFNTASNLGSGVGLFDNKTGVDLRFRSLKAGSNVAISNSVPGEVQISVPAIGEVNTGSNLGAGTPVFAQKSGVNFQYRTLIAGPNISISNDANTVTISSTDTGEVNTASNLGTGQGIFSSKSGVNLQFKSLKAGAGVTLSSDANEVTIASTSAIVSWIHVQSNTNIPASGGHYSADTTSAPLTLTLASTLTNAFDLFIKDAVGTFGTNNLTIDRPVGATYNVPGGWPLVIDVNYPEVHLGYDATLNTILI